MREQKSGRRGQGTGVRAQGPGIRDRGTEPALPTPGKGRVLGVPSRRKQTAVVLSTGGDPGGGRGGVATPAQNLARHHRARAFLVTGCLGTVLSLLAWGSTAALSHGTGASPEKKIRICLFPFYDSGSPGVPASDLSPLLGAYLAAKPWLEAVPAREIYEKSYEVEGDPWLVKGVWGEGGQAVDAETYTLLYERWWMKARVRFPSDYAVIGKVIATGRKRTVAVDLLSGTRPDQVVFTSVREAPAEEGIPDALEKLSGELAGFLHVQWLEEHLKELRRKRLAQMCPLAAAVNEAEKAVEAVPAAVSLRLLLLGFYAEDRSAYGKRLIKLAEEIAHRWDPLDEHANQLASELGIDPFLILCEEQEKRGDWSGVLETARLGQQKHPLRSAEYGKWASRAEERLQATDGNSR